MLRSFFSVSVLLALGGCATAVQHSQPPERLDRGVTYRVAVENPSGCSAIVRFGETRLNRGQLIGTVPAHAEDTFVVTPARPGRVTAIALEEDGHMCDRRLDNPVRVTVSATVPASDS